MVRLGFVLIKKFGYPVWPYFQEFQNRLVTFLPTGEQTISKIRFSTNHQDWLLQSLPFLYTAPTLLTLVYLLRPLFLFFPTAHMEIVLLPRSLSVPFTLPCLPPLPLYFSTIFPMALFLGEIKECCVRKYYHDGGRLPFFFFWRVKHLVNAWRKECSKSIWFV